MVLPLWRIVSRDPRNVFGMTSVESHWVTEDMAQKFCDLLNEGSINREYWVEKCLIST